MCKIFAVINKKKENAGTINKLIQANIEKIAWENSGYSVFREKTTTNYIGDNAYKVKNMTKNLEYKGEEIFIIHSRTATCGEDGVDGLHLQNINGYVFAHNGTVTKYNKVDKKSDSYYFFKHYLLRYNKITPENIVEWGSACGFSGKGLLYNPEKKDLIFFANMAGQITAIDNALIISSYEIETEFKKLEYKKILGFSWLSYEGKEKISGILHQEKLDDIYLRFKNGRLTSEADIKISRYPGSVEQGAAVGYWDEDKKEFVRYEDEADKLAELAHLTLDDFDLTKAQEKMVQSFFLEGFEEEEVLFMMFNDGLLKLDQQIKPEDKEKKNEKKMKASDFTERFVGGIKIYKKN